MSQPGMVSHGLPPRDNDVQRSIRELERKMSQMHGMLVQASNAANAAAAAANAAVIATQATQVDVSGININSGAWQEYAVTHVLVPSGFTKAFVTVFATAGVTLTTMGAVQVQPEIGLSEPGPSAPGPSVANGTNGAPCSVSAYFGATLTGLTGGQSIRVSTLAATIDGTPQANSGNVHVTSTWLFTKS